MSKALIIGDCHLKISHLELSKSVLYWIKDVFNQHKPDLVVNLGDTFDSHSVLRAEIMAEFISHVKQITATTPYIYVLGNHDMAKVNDSTYHALQSFQDVPGLTVITKPTNIDGITYVPYIPNPRDFPSKTEEICIAHQTFLGADFGFYRPEDGVNPEDILAEIIISGHIHKRQSFGKVVYPGTPYAFSASDCDQVKGISIFDTETYKFEFIEAPFPQWRKIDISDLSDANYVTEMLKNTLNNKDVWILAFSGLKSEISEYINSKDFKDLKLNKTIKVKAVFTNKDKTKVSLNENGDILNIIYEYIDKVYSGALAKDVLKDRFQKILAKTGR